MDQPEGRRSTSVDAARMLTGAAGWVAVASFLSPWSRGEGTAEVGFSGLAGVRGLGAVDVQGRGPLWLDTVHWVDGWLVLAAALVLWAAAAGWHRRPVRTASVGAAGAVLLLGVAAVVLPMVSPGDGAPWYGPYLAGVAGIAGLTGGLLGRHPMARDISDRPGEMRVRVALVDLGLDRHATPRLARGAWAVLAVATVGAYLVVLTATVFDELATGAEPAAARALSGAAAVVLLSAALAIVLALLRVAAEFVVLPFRILDALREVPSSAPEPSGGAAAPAPPREPLPGEQTGPEPAPPSPPATPAAAPTEPEPQPAARPVPGSPDDLWAEPGETSQRPVEPEPWARPVEPPPRVKVHGTADDWYRREPEAGGHDRGHPLRRDGEDDDGA